MSVRSTKTRTAALSVSVRSQPLPWSGNRRIVRSISARRLLMVVRRSIMISRNCSQKSGSSVVHARLVIGEDVETTHGRPVIGEGVETTLAARQLRFRPVWGSLGV
jgi:hypothetical protein